jgi:hypothetical protein
MSEVDRLSNSGLYPALPIADKRSSKDDPEQGPGGGRPPDKPAAKGGDGHESAPAPRPPKSLLDEYA